MGGSGRTEDDLLEPFNVPILPRWVFLEASRFEGHPGCRGRVGILDCVSIQAINWAFDQTIESSSCKFILVCLANYANESSEAYPSVETISRMTGLDRKTIISGLGKLCASGVLTDTGKRVGHTCSIPVYKLSQKRNYTENGTVPKTDGRCPKIPDKQSRFSVKLSQKRDTEPSVTVKEPSEGNRTRKFVSELNAQIKLASERIIQLKDAGDPKSATEIKELCSWSAWLARAYCRGSCGLGGRPKRDGVRPS